MDQLAIKHFRELTVFEALLTFASRISWHALD